MEEMAAWNIRWPHCSKDAGGWMHEWMHSWYQGMLGTNELKYPWMDEGFTQYAAARNGDI